MSEMVRKPPATRAAGSSNLSLVSAVSVGRDRLAPFEIPFEITLDVSQWGAVDDAGKPVARMLVSFTNSSSYRYHRGLARFGGTAYRHWRRVVVFAADPEAATSSFDGPPTRNGSERPTELVPVFDALVYLASTLVTRGQGDRLLALRDLTADQVSSLVQWAACSGHLGGNDTPDLHDLVSQWSSYCARYAELRVPGVAYIGGRAGARGIALVSDVAGGGDERCTCTAMREDGILLSNAWLRQIVEPGSDAMWCAALTSRMAVAVVDGLNRANENDTFAGLEPGAAKELSEFVGSEMVGDGATWHKLLAGYRNVAGVPVVAHDGFGTAWVREIAKGISWGAIPQQVNKALNYGQRIEVSAVDIAEFARTSVPANGLVQSVTMLKNGRVRVVLREPVYPTMVQRRGRIYVEDEPGTVLSDMAVHAFDLDFRGTVSSFPDAKAWADAECTRTARHTNITSGDGRVCLGDINTQMSRNEVNARGGISMPCVADFLQMLRQCNLDSAYNRDKHFLLADPDSVSDEEWARPVWDIPGLRLIEAHVRIRNEEET